METIKLTHDNSYAEIYKAEHGYLLIIYYLDYTLNANYYDFVFPHTKWTRLYKYKQSAIRSVLKRMY